MSAPIRSRRIGATSLTVTELGLGTAPLGNLYQPVSDQEASDTVAAALSAGIAYFDTAPFYGFGLSERRLGDALRGSGATVSSKAGRLLKADRHLTGSAARYGFHSPMPFEPIYDYSFDGILRSWEDSQQRLGLARIDILFVHDIGRLTQGERHAATLRQLTEGGGLRALDQLRSAGEIQAFGIGVNETAICLEVMDHARLDVILLAGRYTLLEQGALDAVLPACLRAGTSLIIGGPYNSGILASGTRRGGALHYNYEMAPPGVIQQVRRLEAQCDRHGVPLAAAALQFPLAHPQVSSVIPGLIGRQQIERTLSWYRTRIADAFWQELKHEGLLPAEAPVPVLDTAGSSA